MSTVSIPRCTFLWLVCAVSYFTVPHFSHFSSLNYMNVLFDAVIFLEKSFEKKEENSLLSENLKLRQELLNYRMHENKYKKLVKNLKYQEEPYHVVLSASVSGRVTFRGQQLLMVRINPPHHVCMNDIAMGEKGVIGRVVEVGHDFIYVLPLSSTLSSVPVLFKENQAFVSGEGEKVILDSPNPKEGDELITSGVGGIFPAGLPVGKTGKNNRVELYEKSLESLYVTIIRNQGKTF
jgi:rod shape-determining protein MreC